MSAEENPEGEDEIDGELEDEPPATVQRTPTVLLLDTSYSMKQKSRNESGEKKQDIEHVIDGLSYFKEELGKVDHAKTRVDVAIFSFGGDVSVAQDPISFDGWDSEDLDLEATGQTPMGEAIQKGIKMAEKMKSSHRSDGIPVNRPLIWLLTDGEPTDMDEGDQTWNHVQDLLDEGTTDKHFKFFAMGVGDDANMDVLESLVSVTDEDAIHLAEGNFIEFFQILSNSLDDHSDETNDNEPSAQRPTSST